MKNFWIVSKISFTTFFPKLGANWNYTLHLMFVSFKSPSLKICPFFHDTDFLKRPCYVSSKMSQLLQHIWLLLRAINYYVPVCPGFTVSWKLDLYWIQVKHGCPGIIRSDLKYASDLKTCATSGHREIDHQLSQQVILKIRKMASKKCKKQSARSKELEMELATYHWFSALCTVPGWPSVWSPKLGSPLPFFLI